MDSRPIGVFDSGLGGLSVLKELISILPNEDIIYFGDTGRVPYGGRSTEIILKYTKQDIRKFKNISDLRDFYVATVDRAALDISSSEECKDCISRELGSCSGGCLLYKAEQLFA